MSHNSKYYKKSVKRLKPDRSLFDCGVTVKGKNAESMSVSQPENEKFAATESQSTSNILDSVSDNPPCPSSTIPCDEKVVQPEDDDQLTGEVLVATKLQDYNPNTQSVIQPEVDDQLTGEMLVATKLHDYNPNTQSVIQPEVDDQLTDEVLVATKLQDYNPNTNQFENQFQSSSCDSIISKQSTINYSSLDNRKTVLFKYELQYPWMYHSASKGGIICKYCELYARDISSDPAYVSVGAILGTHPSRRLKTHEDSTRHQQSLARYTSPDPKTISEVFQDAEKQKPAKDAESQAKNRAHVKKVMKMVLFLVSQKWGYTDNLFQLASHVADLGDEELAAQLTKPTTYCSSTSATEMVHIISTYLDNLILDNLRGNKLTLFLDESTDNSNRSQASIMARYVNKQNGKVEEKFLGLYKLPGAKAVNFEEAVTQFFTQKNLDTNLIRFVALDGCNTMSGERKGLQKRVRHMAPHSLYVNCRNHKLALCFTHLVKRNRTMEAVEDLLIGIWKLFAFSPKRATVLCNTQLLYDQNPLKFTRAAATRWLSHFKACQRFVSRYESLLDTLDSLEHERNDQEVHGIKVKATSQKIVFTALLLTDILKPVNELNLYLQADTGFFVNLDERVKACSQKLEDLAGRLSNGDFQDLEFSKVEEMSAHITEHMDLARRMRRQEIYADPAEYLRLVGVPLIYELINEIQDAFVVTSPVLAAFSVLDPSQMPNEIDHAYGIDKIKTLADHYGKSQVDEFEGHRKVAPADVEPLVEHELLAFRTHLFIMK